MDFSFLSFLHSLLRYAVLLAVVLAFLMNLRGWLMSRPILSGERMITIIAMVLCHVQLVIGIILYLQNMTAINRMTGALGRFWKFEHIGTMILAVALITAGRMLSKRAPSEPVKQRHIAVFYGIGLVLMLWAVPWPFREIGHGLGWL
jgi:hypothetical protein